MPFCSNCGSGLQESSRFCAACGAANTSGSEVQVTLDRSPSSPIPPPPPASSGSQSRISSTSLRGESGRILPGTLLADRYRIVALIGRGGMGEVYRAEDLKLDQDVALKFLPEKLVQDGAALARFHREVRIAREISHPNVCRVFDIGETNGVPFISMEYVDGEDLSTLLRRIGRLPQDRAIEIARQLCAGVAAAHDHGVLHRDLKPSNVMLDDRGKIRIMDFGLAGVASDIKGAEVSSGTPAYMAPEQLSGKEVTVQSDIYALGLVLYEIFTGKRAFEAASVADLIRQRERSSPTNPAEIVRDLDPLVVRVILRCLDSDPLRRPKTALQVSAALPGGDPLAAALAAGETPSPQMVAAAGGDQALSPRLAWTGLGCVILVFIAVLWTARYSGDLALYPVSKSPDVLEDRAIEIAAKAGYSTPADRHWVFDRNYSYLLYRNANRMPSPKGQPISGANPGALSFDYRQAFEPMVPANLSSQVRWTDPPLERAGMVLVQLDSVGRLRYFRGVPNQEQTSQTAMEPDWRLFFEAAGLDPGQLKTAPAKWIPNEPFDLKRDWEGSYPGDKTPIHVTAASVAGKPVYFRVIPPWSTTPEWTVEEKRSSSTVIALATVICGGFALMTMAIVLARKNILLGRGDRKGAFHLAAFFFLGSAMGRLLLAHHVPDIGAEFDLLVVPTSLALLASALLWIYYVALEPHVRSRWPEFLISWTRLLRGNFRDPMVGRDLLAGIVFGLIYVLGAEIVNALPAWFHLVGQTPINNDGAILGSAVRFTGLLLQELVGGVFSALTILFMFVLIRTRIKSYWVSSLVVAALLTLTLLGNENVVAETALAITMAVLIVFVLLRFGLLALAVGYTCVNLLVNAPLGLDPSRWYFSRGLVPLLIVLALALYGFRTSLGSRPVFSPLTADD